MTQFCLGDWTPSDSGPWMTEWDNENGVPHVIPAFGPKHELSWQCWCHPVPVDDRYTEPVVSHNVAQ